MTSIKCTKRKTSRMATGVFDTIKGAFRKAAAIIRPKNRFEWVLLAIAVPVPLGVVTWVLIKSMKYKKKRTYALVQKSTIIEEEIYADVAS
ncbi:MAG: hypothetical protein PF505_01315 [Vallitaleaceae bacterium]|jgi:hypothetical protein|nr:hypothetical protein [Vallitaleaceae bacterium]